ncbi:MAG TPA: DUF6049 family protein, partial [Nocardioides sp.]
DGAGVTEQHALLLPALWDPADGGSPTDGLTTGWLRSVPVTELGDTVDADPTEIALADVAGPIDTSAALPDDLFVMSRALVTRGARLDSILPETDAVRPQTERAAATLLSYQHRGDLARVRSGARDQVHQVQGLLGRVTVEAPPTVTLSGDDGDFNVRVVNGLDQPVVIRLRGDESQRVTLEPSGPVEVPAGGSANVRMTVEMHRIGVFDVDVRVVDETDTALGGAVVVPVRSAAVSDIIWAVMGGSFVVLVGATLWWYRRRPQQQQRISTPASVAAASRPEDADEPGETDPGEDAR